MGSLLYLHFAKDLFPREISLQRRASIAFGMTNFFGGAIVSEEIAFTKSK